MTEEQDNQLVTKYPKIFANRYKSMQETCMCWGFECGSGWYNILDQLCCNIQSHIDHNIKVVNTALQYNEAIERALHGNPSFLINHFTYDDTPSAKEYAAKKVHEILSCPEPQMRTVPATIPQVVASQVKEKFGTLRFYYEGGDDHIDGMVRMAEAMSSVTCEVCGVPGEMRQKGPGAWISTLCDEHAKK